MQQTASRSVRELPLAAGGEVDISLVSADVTVRGTDGDLVVVRTRGGGSLDGEVEIDATPGRVSIRDAERGFRIGPMRMRGPGAGAPLEIELPRTARLSYRTVSGDVTADGIGRDSRWATVSGDLRLAVDGGAVSVESMSGDITIDADGAIGLKARAVSGDVRLRAPAIDALAVSTTSGDVRVAGVLGPAFDHQVSSVSGDVFLATPSPVRLETQSIAGDVRASGVHRSEGGRGRRSIVVGDGSVRVSVKTTSGDVRLEQEGSGMPAPFPAAAPPVAPRPPVAPEPPVAPVPPAPLTDPSRVVAEAEAAPNLVRPSDAWSAAGSATDRREAARLDILRALERGELDIEAASHRLEQLDEAGPRHFRGFC